ncbi:MAG: ABC transporter substrate-binding protein [Chloroflexi bacterium]|nr:ABC transporter substrate-binding protein [Chloroflexota bacterium]
MASGVLPASIKPLTQRVKVTITVSQTPSYLPLFVAQEKGYFSQAGLDVDLKPFQQSAATQMPLLARGDIDLTPVVPVPALYNQAVQGFNIKMIHAFEVPMKGRETGGWLSVIKDEAGAIKQLSDMKGKTVNGLVEGTPAAFLLLEALRQANLTPDKDVTVKYGVKSPGDQLALVRAHAADVFSLSEPNATQLEREGSVVRWKTYDEIAPWYQADAMAVSGVFQQKHPDALEKYTEVYLAAVREINAANGKWSDELLRIATKWTPFDAAIMTSMGGVPYFEPNGQVSLDSFKRTEDTWVQDGQVKTPVDVNQLVDNGPVQQALQTVGKA